MATKRLLLLVLMVAGTGTCGAQEQSPEITRLARLPAKLFPVDEGEKDPSFGTFRKTLVEAVSRGDLKVVLTLFDTNVRVGLRTDAKGIDALRRNWEIDKSPDRFLRELGSILQLGGRLIPGPEFHAPYVATDFPETDPDEIGEYAVVIRRDAPCFREPRMDGGVAARLTYDIVHRRSSRVGWVEVHLRDGRKCFMQEGAVRSPVDTQVRLAKVSGVWRVVEFNKEWD